MVWFYSCYQNNPDKYNAVRTLKDQLGLHSLIAASAIIILPTTF